MRCNQLFKILLDSFAARLGIAIAMADKYLRPSGIVGRFDEVEEILKSIFPQESHMWRLLY